MSEAVLLAILAPIAALISTLIIKLWEQWAGRRKASLEEGVQFRDELRAEMARKDKENESLRAQLQEYKDADKNDDYERNKWRDWYFELYSMFYGLRLLVKSNFEEDSNNPLSAVAFGIAPHERDSLDK